MGKEGPITRARPARFKQVDLTRAVKALQAAGIHFNDIEIKIDTRGGIRIMPKGDAPIEGANEWDADLQ